VGTAFEDPDIRATWDDSMEEIQDVVEYILKVKADREEHLGNDLLSALITAEVNGDKLDDLELATFFVLLLAAGNDSTRSTYSGTMKALMENPDQLQLLLDDPTLVTRAVEEGVRCFPPFSFMARAATKDVELRGQTIKEGDRVLLWYIASNRDPERWGEDADEFNILREGNDDHQGFGAGGRHFCLGAALARLELKVWLEETLKRFPNMRLDGDCPRMKALFLNQYTSIPVRMNG
jgi:cytochrome P450